MWSTTYLEIGTTIQKYFLWTTDVQIDTIHPDMETLNQTCVQMSKKKREGVVESDRHTPRKMVPVPAQWYDALAAMAKANERPVAWELRLAIADRLKAHKRKVPDEA